MILKFTETRSFLKAIIVIIIAVLIAIPAAYMFLPEGRGSIALQAITSPEDSTPQDPEPEPDPDNDDDQTVIYSSGGGSSGGGGGSSGSDSSSDNGDDEEEDNSWDKNIFPAEHIPPDFKGHWGLGVYDENPLGYLNGNKILSKTRPGEIADFNEAMSVIIEADENKEQFLQKSEGSGARGSNGVFKGVAISRNDKEAFSKNLEGIADGTIGVR